MSIINIVGLVFLIVVLAGGTVLKLFTRKKLKEIDGLGEIGVKDENHKNTIKIS